MKISNEKIENNLKISKSQTKFNLGYKIASAVRNLEEDKVDFGQLSMEWIDEDSPELDTYEDHVNQLYSKGSNMNPETSTLNIAVYRTTPETPRKTDKYVDVDIANLNRIRRSFDFSVIDAGNHTEINI